MPRTARIKSPGGIYHIMVRSISEMPLFKSNADKEKYLNIIKKYQQEFMFKVYSYCLMTTHAHLIIDCSGADISKFMHSINLSYAIYFNKCYNRHGHVFQDRYKSKMVTDDRYLLMLSAYIHNNPKDMKKYRNNIERYKYSSLGIYLGIRNDEHKILNPDFILQQFGSNKKESGEAYFKFVSRYSESNGNRMKEEFEFKDDGSEYRSERTVLIRNYSPQDVVSFIVKNVEGLFNINIKYNHRNAELRAVSVICMRSLCNFTLKQIGAVLGNITISTVWKLCERGLKLITEDNKYKFVIGDLLKSCVTE